MVNLSLGLAYVHYGLKRQSTNRQYLLLQGQTYLSRYVELGKLGVTERGSWTRAEAYYNIGRLYQLLGVNYLAHDYYSRARKACYESYGQDEARGLEVMVLSNELISLIINYNSIKALTLLKVKLKL